MGDDFKHLVIGQGEIGTSMYNILKEGGVDVQIRDKDSEIVGQFNYLHLAIPFTDQDSFINICKEYERQYNPYTVVVHSTVGLGTIRLLGEKYVHAPIRGRHPHLEEGIREFKLYVGGNDTQRVSEVAEFYRPLIKEAHLLDPAAYPPETTEALKLWCTTYYGWIILFEKEIHKFCEERGLPFEIVYEDLNKTYNAGYTKLGEPQFVRPVLKHIPGPTGGHCVRENCKLLGDTSYIPQLILEKNDTFDN
jgi:hypothetical protein